MKKIFSIIKFLPIILIIIFSFISAASLIFQGDDFIWYFINDIEEMSGYRFPNGRYFTNFLTYIMVNFPLVNYILYTAALSALIILMANLADHEKKSGVMKYALTFSLFIMLPTSIYSNTITWISGFTNYVISILLTLAYIFFCFRIIFDKNYIPPKIMIILAPILGLAGALCVEHISLYNILVHMADATMMIKYIIHNTALKHGKTATFMPKPIYGEAGSGMHVHMLLMKDGKPVFSDDEGYAHLSETAHYFMGGLLKHIASLCALTNPSTNSFKRLVPGFEAPVTVGYATSNRSAVIRIPAYAKSPDKRRFELRNPDATCNPYFCYAAILMAGLDGVKNKIDPHANGWGPYDVNLYHLSDEEKAKLKHLPTSLDEALDALEKDHDYLTEGGVFPEELLKNFIRTKREECRQLAAIPHPAEFDRYYNL